MKIVRYDSTVDALYIDLSEKLSADTIEVQPGVMVDYDEEGNVVGVEVLDFMKRMNQETPDATLQSEQSDDKETVAA